MRGRKPTPNAVLRLVGSRKVRQHEPSPPAEAPSMPSWLSAEAKREWRRVVPGLVRVGVICGLDRAVLAAYCQCWGEYIELAAAVCESGTRYRTPNGCTVQHPYVSMRNTARAAMLRFAQELGLSPSARSRVVGLPRRGASDPLGDFVRKGKPGA